MLRGWRVGNGPRDADYKGPAELSDLASTKILTI